MVRALYLVAAMPEVEARIAAEPRRSISARMRATEALPSLVYTRAVVQEALRLYPPALTWRAWRAVPIPPAEFPIRRARSC